MKFFNLDVDFLLSIIDKKSEDPDFINNTIITKHIFNNKPNFILEILVKKYVYEILNLIFSRKIFYTGNDIEKLENNLKIIKNSVDNKLDTKKYEKYPLYTNQETGIKVQPIFPNISKKKDKYHLKIYINEIFCEKVLLINYSHLSKIITNIFNKYVKLIFSNKDNIFKKLHIENGIELSFYNNFMEIDISIVTIQSNNNMGNITSLLNLNPIKNTFNIYTITNIKPLSQKYNLNNLNLTDEINDIMNIGSSNKISNTQVNKLTIDGYIFELKFLDDTNYYDKINISDTNFIEIIEIFNNIDFSNKNPDKYLKSFIYDNSLLINISEMNTLNTHIIDMELIKRLGKWYRIQDIVYPYFRLFNENNINVYRLSYSELPIKFNNCEYCNIPLCENFYIFYDSIISDLKNDINPGNSFEDNDINEVMNALDESNNNNRDNSDSNNEPNSPPLSRVYAKKTKSKLRLTKGFKTVKRKSTEKSKETGKEKSSENEKSTELNNKIPHQTNSIYQIIQDIECLYNDEPIKKNMYYEKWGIEFVPICCKCAHSNLYLEFNHNILICNHPRTKIDVINMIKEENIKKILLELYNYLINQSNAKIKRKNMFYNEESLCLNNFKLIKSYELHKIDRLFCLSLIKNNKFVPINTF